MLTLEELYLIVQTLEAKINHDEIMIESFLKTYKSKSKSVLIEQQKELVEQLKEIVVKLNYCIDDLENM